MGCFSFLCKNSGEPALSTGYDGSTCKPVGLFIRNMIGSESKF